MHERTAGRSLLLALLLLSSVGLGGCALLQTLAGDKRPELTFREVRFTGWSLDQVHLDVIYELDNPYDIPLSLASVAYDLEVEGRKILSGAPKEGLKIQPRKSQQLVFPASVRFLDVIPTVEALFRKSALGYRASGEIGVQTPVGVIGLPLSKSGDIDVPTLPSIELASVSVPKKSLTQATVEVALDLTNRNDFAIPMAGIDYALRLGGAQVGGGKSQGKTLRPGERTRIQIPIGVNLVGAGQGVLALVSGKPADVGLEGKLALGGIEAPLDLKKRLTIK